MFQTGYCWRCNNTVKHGCRSTAQQSQQPIYSSLCLCHWHQTSDPEFRPKEWDRGTDFVNQLMSAVRSLCAGVSQSGNGIWWMCEKNWLVEKNWPALCCPSRPTRVASSSGVNTFIITSLSPIITHPSPALVWPTGFIIFGRPKDIVRSHSQIFFCPFLFLF